MFLSGKNYKDIIFFLYVYCVINVILIEIYLEKVSVYACIIFNGVVGKDLEVREQEVMCIFGGENYRYSDSKYRVLRCNLVFYV